MKTMSKYWDSTMWDGLRYVGTCMINDIGIPFQRLPFLNTKSESADCIQDSEINNKTTDMPNPPVPVSGESQSCEKASLAESVSKSNSAVPTDPEQMNREFLLTILNAQESFRANLDSQLRAIGASHESLANQVGKIEAAYKDIFNENQGTIRRLTDNVRTLQDRAFREVILKPLLRDLISLNDSLVDLRKILCSIEGKVSLEAISLSEALEASLADILARQGVTRMSGENLTLDLRRHKIISVERATIPKSEEVIPIGPGGYEWDDQVLRYQGVNVRKMQ